MSDYDAFLTAAAELLGPKGFTADPDELTPWLTDWRGRYTGTAIALASPASTQQVSALIKLCGRHSIPVVPQGGNSGMSGGATPGTGGTAILLSLRRMAAIRMMDPENRQIRCDAGLILQHLHDAAADVNLRFPLTLGGKGSATVGGLISTNAGGTQVLRHGTMRAQVLGIEAVMADGGILDAMVPLKKDNRGFDLKQLLIGSEGTLGIVTGATLKLAEPVGGRVVLWAGMDNVADARRLLLDCDAHHGDALEGFEIVPDHCLGAVLDYLPDARNPLDRRHRWYALIEIVAKAGDADILAGIAENILTRAFARGWIQDGTFSTNESQADRFWLLRDSISAAERAIGPAMQHDISVPVEKMPEFIEATIADVERAFPGCTALAFGHLGDGNVHFHVLAPTKSQAKSQPGSEPRSQASRGEWENAQGSKISAFVHDRVTQWGGSISAEHGIGQMKLAEFGRLGDPVSLSILRQVKHALDPHNLLNPGKLVPPDRADGGPGS